MSRKVIRLLSVRHAFILAGSLILAPHVHANPSLEPSIKLSIGASIEQGRKSMLRAEELQQQSRLAIQRSQTLRAEIKARLAPAPPSAHLKQQAGSEESADDLLAKSRELHTQGSQQRAESVSLQKKAEAQLASGLRHLFPDWLATGSAIKLANTIDSSLENAPVLGGHNTAQRSTHPRKKALLGSPETISQSNMSLQLPKMAAQQLPVNVSTSTFTLSRERQYLAHIAVVPGAQKRPLNSVSINDMHSWYLVLTDTYGKAVVDANIRFNGHMPGHVHGLPTQPRVTQQPADGVYLIEGIKFQMSGWWVIDLDINQDADNLRFNLNL